MRRRSSTQSLKDEKFLSIIQQDQPNAGSSVSPAFLHEHQSVKAIFTLEQVPLLRLHYRVIIHADIGSQ